MTGMTAQSIGNNTEEAVRQAMCQAVERMSTVRSWHRQGHEDPLYASGGRLAVDLGVESLPEASAKLTLAAKLNQVIDQRRLNQLQVAALTGMGRSKVCQLRQYKLQEISLERIMQALMAMDQKVTLVVRDK